MEGEKQEVLGLGEVTERTKAADKKTHPSAPAGNNHPHEDKRVWASLSSLVPPTLRAPHARGFTAL